MSFRPGVIQYLFFNYGSLRGERSPSLRIRLNVWGDDISAGLLCSLYKSDGCFLNVEPRMPSRHVSLSRCSSEGIKQDGRDAAEVNLLFLPSDVTIKSTSKILPSPCRLFICYPSLELLKCMPVRTLSPCADSKHQLSSNQHPPVTCPAWWTALQPPGSSGDHRVASRGAGGRQAAVGVALKRSAQTQV